MYVSFSMRGQIKEAISKISFVVINCLCPETFKIPVLKPTYLQLLYTNIFVTNNLAHLDRLVGNKQVINNSYTHAPWSL